MNPFLSIAPPNQSIKATVKLPASKSISNRLLILQQLFPEKIEIENLSDANDTILLDKLLNCITQHRNLPQPLLLDCQNAGTVCRFLTAMLSITEGTFILDGSQRMKERPISSLVHALTDLEANISYLEKEGFLPLKIQGTKLRTGVFELHTQISSQFISALLMILPLLDTATGLTYSTEVSQTYVDMTLKLMQQLGFQFTNDKNIISCSQNKIAPIKISVEPDWSSAAFWFQMVALSKSSNVVLLGLKNSDLQGDSVLPRIFNSLGVRSTFTEEGLCLEHSLNITDSLSLDMQDYPDIVPSIAVTGALLNIPLEIRGIAHLKAKESNRIHALIKEISKFHAAIHATENSLFIETCQHLPPQVLEFETYNDHRMAMCLAPASLVFGKIQIQSPEVVEKSYPGFWEDLKNAGFNFATEK